MSTHRKHARAVAVVSAALLAVGLSACTTSTSDSTHDAKRSLSGAAPVAGTSSDRVTSPARSSSAPPTTSAASPGPRHRAARTPVHVSSSEADGKTYGIGMPIILQFSHKITDPAALRKYATVTVNGTPAHGAWFGESSAAGYAMEAHYRAAHMWPAHSHIHVSVPLKGRSAGHGLVFDDNLTLSLEIGAAHVSTVDASTSHPHMVVTSDGKVVKRLPASLGAADTPTYRGTKIVEEFDRVENMEGTPVPWSVRVTNSGEFVHAASWNGEIGAANTSHGCTNLHTSDAEWFYNFSRLGDVVDYPNAPGPLMQEWDGLGDWNVSWPEWQAGGSL